MARDDRRTSTFSTAAHYSDHGDALHHFLPKLFVAFEALAVASVLPSFLLVTFQAIYNSGVEWQWALIYALDVVYFAFMIMRFFPRPGEDASKNRKEVILGYLKSGFVPDLLSVVPVELCAFGAGNVIHVASFLRLNRCLRFYRGWTYLSGKEKQLGTNTMLLMSLRFIFLAAMSVHIIAGVWYSLACYNKVVSTLSTGVCKTSSWAQHPDIDWRTAGDLDKYIVTLYWAVTTITSVGYGDILPSTSGEKWVATLCMLWGVILFGYILGSLASMLTNSDAQRSRYIHRLNAIRDHLNESGVSDELRKKVIGYYEYLWQRNKGKGVTELFEELPLAFQAELSLETYRAMIEMSSLFDKAGEEFMRMLSLVVKHTLYLPGQVIINKGDIGHHMYFIRKGEVEVLEEEFSPPVTSFKEGQLFGEVNLVYSVPCGGTIRAKTHCDILLLSKTDTHHVLQHFPEMSRHMKEEMKRRCDVAFNPSTTAGVSDMPSVHITEPIPEGKKRSSVLRDHRKGRGRMSHDKGQITPAPTELRCCSGRLGRAWSRYAIIPGSTFALAWDLIVVVVTIAVCWLYSYQAGFSQFKPSSVGYSSGVVGWLGLAVSYGLDLVLVADVVLSLKRAIRTPTEMVTHSWTIARHYLLSPGFYLDVAAVLPLEVFSLIWVATPHFWGFMALFRSNRIIKLWKVVSFFSDLEGSLYISIAQSTAIKFAIYILTATHLGACLWYPIACFTGSSCVHSSWAAAHDITRNTTGFHDYLISLYWSSATMTTVGYGDISAYNIQEMVLSLIIQLFGVMLYGYCLGAIAATLTNVASPRVSFQEKMQVVHQFMFDHKLGKGLLERVDHYFTLLWSQYRGEAVPGGLRLMHDMPRSIQQDVSMEEASSLLSNAPFFQHVDVSFLRNLSLVTSTYLFSPGDIVLYSGDMGREMYFIRKGYVEILTEDMFHVVCVLKPGSYFGELGFLFGAPRSAAVRAATHLELVMLDRSDMDTILESYPLIAKDFERLSADTEHLASSQESAKEASARAMNSPKIIPKPCIMSALAIAMATPLSVGVRAPLANTIAACVGGKDTQRKVSCPVSIGEPVAGNVVRFSRKELQQLLKGDQESSGIARQPTGLRRRRPTSAVSVARSRPQEAWVEGEGVGVTGVPAEQGRGSIRRRLATAIEKIFSYCLIPFTVVPTSLLGQVWEVVATLLALASAITISLQAAFLHDDPLLWTVNYVIDIFFFADVVLKMHTAFHNKEGVLITQPVACAKHYFKTNFLMDFLSSFPTDFVVLVSWPRDISDVLRVLSLGRLNRVLRLYKLPLSFNYLEGQIGRSTGLIKEVKFAVYMSVCTHLTACGWFLLACASLNIVGSQSHTCKAGSWALEFSDVPLSDYSSGYQYVVSLYWATATTTTVGYGDIRAYTDLERVYSSFVMVLGVVAYGYIIASVAASLANADSGRAQYQDKLKAVKSYLQDQSMDSSITKRVVNYYEYIWQRNKGVSFVSLFQGMPISLQADISLSLYKKIIDQVPLFQNTEIGFTKLLALSIKPVLFLSKEYVVRKGDIGSEMFFINRGTVEVVSEDGTVVFATMNEGKFFGEISLVFSCPRTASIRAATNCDLFVLSKTDLDRSLLYYPDIAEQIRIVAGTRANLVKKRSQIAAKAAAEGKSASDAAKEAAQGTKEEGPDEDKAADPPAPSSSSSSSSSPPPAATADDKEPTKDEKPAATEDKKEAEAKPKAPAATTPEATQKEAASTDGDQQPPPPPPPSFLKTCCAQRVWPRVRRLLTFTIAREGMVGTSLHLAGCLMAYFSAFTISYQACFQNNSPILWGINYVFEAYFLVEIFLKFHLAYEDEQGRTEENFKAIARHYLRAPSGFLLDMVAIFPYELFALPIPYPAIRKATLLYLRLPHVARVVRTQWFFSAEEKRLNQKTVLLRLLKFIVLISLCTHFVACLWYVMGCQASTCRASSWANTANFVGTAMSDADHYCNSLYWAVATMTTTGYGDLSATNVQEMLYAIVVMVVGKLLFGFILGSIASTLANLDTQRVMFEEKINALKDYMKEQHLSSLMRTRVLDFFEYLWLRNKGTDRQGLFADMPYCMQAEVSLATTEALLKRVPIFEQADWAFLRHLTLVIKPCLFLPGEIIVHRGDVGLGMFFLYHGSVEVVDDDDPGAVKEVLSEGSYLGLKSLLYHTPMESSVRAVTHVDMFTFGQTDYEKVLLDHPTIEAMVREVGEKEFGTPVPAVHT